MSKYFDVIIVKNQSEISEAISKVKMGNPNMTVGFVPTMGALHKGHMSLIDKARQHADIVICSIFVNPTQFNNPEDLRTYPRNVEADQQLLIEHGCDILLLPEVEAVYPNGPQPYEIDLEGLDLGMEGAFRPGHFKGVCMVVERFFEIVTPDFAFFGYKDFQQVAIIRKMTEIREFAIKIIGVPIKRAENGLALSSRNALLSEEQRSDAALISSALRSGLDFYRTAKNANSIKNHILSHFETSYMEVEYVEIVNNVNLEPVQMVDENCTVCIVVYCGKVRLIDNMQFADAIEKE